MNGQLMPREREWLHSLVAQRLPNYVIEIGTWKGGGSTLQIREALEKNGKGILYSCEPDKECFDEALSNHFTSPVVTIFNKGGEWLIQHMLDEDKIPDFVFFDGPEDPQITLDLFKQIEPHLVAGAWFVSHDWDSPPSQKNVLLRPYLEASADWVLRELLHGEGTVGMPLYCKIR